MIGISREVVVTIDVITKSVKTAIYLKKKKKSGSSMVNVLSIAIRAGH